MPKQVISTFPIVIQNRIQSLQEQNGNERDIHSPLFDSIHLGFFEFEDTAEGETIWDEVANGNFESFYKFHNLDAHSIR